MKNLLTDHIYSAFHPVHHPVEVDCGLQSTNPTISTDTLSIQRNGVNVGSGLFLLLIFARIESTFVSFSISVKLI